MRLTYFIVMNNPLFGKSRYAPVGWLLFFTIIISFVTRVVLWLSFYSTIDISWSEIIPSFAIGFVYDLLVSLVIIIPFILQILFTNNFIYSKKGKWITIAFFIVLLSIWFFSSIIPKEYNKGLYTSLTIYLLVRIAIYFLLLNASMQFRLKWRSVVLQVFFFITVFLLVFNAVSEWFFWNEFGSRYNFIAVDYLIYTNEVVGNIWESYPMVTIIAAIVLVTLILFLPIRKKIARSVYDAMSFGKRLVIGVALMVAATIMVFIVSPGWKYFSKNNYTNELAGNGIYDFVQAFKNNELDFFTYYKTIPDAEAFDIVKKKMEMPGTSFLPGNTEDITRQITDSLPEKKLNVVLISVESLSASFMKAFGNTKNITPQLDSLADHSMFFTNLYAAGTRTVRGLEALTLSIPPLPGESIVKRPGNENMFSIGSVFRSKGYTTQFMYGGYGYFDNMNYFFGNNGYQVIDRTALKPGEIHYANIWGVADEDLFTLAIKTLDSDYHAGKPFFTHIMTVSNHRPYTYPDGRIDIPPSSQTRNGAVKYTDYAIGKFIKEAATKPWFANTVFVIVADHCASSAGKEELPVAGYHIPLLIYSPANIPPQKIDVLTSQIDIAPTILGLLHFNYTTKFYGHDIFKAPEQERRVFISTYQGLGYMRSDTLIVQTPIKKIKAYKINPVNKDATEIELPKELSDEAIAFYQSAAWIIQHKKYNALK